MFDEIRKLGKHSLIYAAGVWTSGAVGFFMIPVYTRCLSPGEYGVLELLNRSLQIILILLGLGLRATVIRFYHDQQDPEYRERAVGSAMSLLFGLAAVSVGAAFAVSPLLSRVLFSSASQGPLVRLMLLAGAAELVLLAPLALMQARTQSLAFTASRASQFMLAIGLNLLLVVGLQKGLPGVMWATFISAAVPATVLALYTVRREGLRFSSPVVREMLRFGLPLVPAGILGFIMNYADRYLLNAYLDDASVGIYSLGYRFGILLAMIVLEPFVRVWMPFQMAALRREDSGQIFGRVLTYVVAVSAWVGLGISVLAADVIRVLSDPAYLSAYRVVPIVAFAYVCWGASLVFDGGIYISKKTIFKPVLLGAAAAISVGANVVLIQAVGMMGAAWAALAANACFAGLTYFVANRVYPIPYEFYRVGKVLLAAIALYWASTLVSGTGALSVVARTAIALSLPLALAVLRFYQRDEADNLRRILRRVRRAERTELEFGKTA